MGVVLEAKADSCFTRKYGWLYDVIIYGAYVSLSYVWFRAACSTFAYWKQFFSFCFFLFLNMVKLHLIDDSWLVVIGSAEWMVQRRPFTEQWCWWNRDKCLFLAPPGRVATFSTSITRVPQFLFPTPVWAVTFLKIYAWMSNRVIWFYQALVGIVWLLHI